MCARGGEGWGWGALSDKVVRGNGTQVGAAGTAPRITQFAAFQCGHVAAEIDAAWERGTVIPLELN